MLQADGSPDPKIYIWDTDMDTVQFFNFQTGHGEQDDLIPDQEGLDMDDVTDAER